MDTGNDEVLTRVIRRRRGGRPGEVHEPLHERISYTHSDGVRHSLESCVGKVRHGFYNHISMSHPMESIIVVERLIADVTVFDTPKQLGNSSLALWIREKSQRMFFSYQLTRVLSRHEPDRYARRTGPAPS